MNSPYGIYQNQKFTDVFENVEEFLGYYTQCKIPQMVSTDSIPTIYYLLYAQYGNSTIINSDVTQFIYKVFSTIFQFGGAWEKKFQIQQALLTTDIDEFNEGTRTIINRALNPATEVTSSQDEILTINEQNTTNVKRGKIETYEFVLEMLDVDYTKQFIDKFKQLFISIVEPNAELLFKEGDEA